MWENSESNCKLNQMSCMACCKMFFKIIVETHEGRNDGIELKFTLEEF